jgi:hypothetical protein
MKIKSPADGTSQRIHAGCASAVKLLEPIAIAVNLIEWDHEGQDHES